MKDKIEVLKCDHAECDNWFIQTGSYSDYYTSRTNWETKGKPSIHQIGCECRGCGAHMCFSHSYTFKMKMGYEFEYASLCNTCYDKLSKLFKLDTLLQIAKIVIEKPESEDEKPVDSDGDPASILRQLELE